MSWTRAFAYAGASLVLALYYVVFEREVAPVQEVARVGFLRFAAEEVSVLVIESPTGRVRCVRSDGGWQVTEPAGAQIAADLIRAMITTLSDLSTVEVVSAEGKSAEEFGLDRPRTRIRLERAAAEPIEVTLGSRNPTQTAVYARHEGSPEIVLLGLNVDYYVDLIVEGAKRSGA